MSKYRALVSFAGKISMYAGEIRGLDDKDEFTKELLRARYIELAEPKKTATRKKK